MFQLEFYFKNPVRPIRLGEERRADKKQDFNGELKDIINVLKEDSDFDNILYVRAIDDEGTKRVDIHPKSHGFDIYCKKLDDLLKFIDPDFIKNKVKEKTGEMRIGREKLQATKLLEAHKESAWENVSEDDLQKIVQEIVKEK